MMAKATSGILIRNYLESDAPHLAAIYFNTIHHINTKDYTKEQVDAWAPQSSCLDLSGWKKKWLILLPIVAELNHVVVGFAEFETNGHIDCFYVHHEYQGIGIGNVLMDEITNRAKKFNINKIYSEVSITAKPFFLAKGFIVIREQIVNLRGVELKNYIMEKNIDSFE